MRSSPIILLLGLTACSERLHGETNQIAPELLAYNLKTTVEAFEKQGHKNPKWDAQAKSCLETFAQIRSMTNGPGEPLVAQLRTNLARLGDLKCDDPMIRYLHLRYVISPNRSATELAPLYSDVAAALEKSGYPPIRKFYARMWMFRATADASSATNASPLLDKAAVFLAEALQDKALPEHEAATCCRELIGPVWLSDTTRWNCYQILEATLTNRWNHASFAHLARGQSYLSYGWKARGTGWASTVSPENWRLFAERLEVASEALEKAWKLDPLNPDICLEMMHVELGQGEGGDRLEMWFKRGMKLSPANWYLCYAKLQYLRPRWYGTIPMMVEFGWQCMTNADYSGEVRLGLVNAHYEVAREMPDKQTMYAYLAKPEVWADIRTNFEYFFKLYPEQVGYRHNYAKFASYAADWDEFMRQVKLFPSTNFSYFGGVEQFNRILNEASQHSSAGKGKK